MHSALKHKISHASTFKNRIKIVLENFKYFKLFKSYKNKWPMTWIKLDIFFNHFTFFPPLEDAQKIIYKYTSDFETKLSRLLLSHLFKQ